MSEKKLFETGVLTEAVEGSDGLIWKVELIGAGFSQNKRRYRAEVLEAAQSLFEKVPVFTDHPSNSEKTERPERSVKDIAGWITDPKWDPSAGKQSHGAIVGSLHLLESNPIAAPIREAYERGNVDLFQLSIHGRIRTKVARENNSAFLDVGEIIGIRSVDLVTAAAAGGRIMDVMHSISTEDEMTLLEGMTIEELLVARPDLKDIIAASTPPDDVLEALSKAQVAAVKTVLDKVAKIDKLPQAATGAVAAARMALGRDDMPNVVKQLQVLAKAEGVPEELRKEVNGLIAKIGYGEPAKDDASDESINRMASEGAGAEPDNKVREEINELRATIKLAECSRTLQEKLGASSLPTPVKGKINKQFSGRVFEAVELDNAISEETEVYNQVVAESPNPYVKVSYAPQDKLVDVVTATILGEAYNGQDPLSSLHRVYNLFKGRNPYDSSAAELATSLVRESIGWDGYGLTLDATEAVNWTAVFGTSMNRALVKDYRELPFSDWELIVSDTRPLKDMKPQEINRIGYYGALPVVVQGAPYEYAVSPGEDDGEYSPAKFGILEEWTWEQALNDDLGALRKIPRRLALAAKATLYQFVYNFLANNPNCVYDDTPLFDDLHSNEGATALTDATLTAAKIAMRRQQALGSNDITLAIRPKYLVVPPDLEATAIRLRNSEYTVAEEASTVANVHKGTFEIIVVDYWSDTNNWYLVADPAMVPTIEVGFLDNKREPELFTEASNSGSNFSADKVIIKVRFVFGGTIVDHRGFYGGIVTG